VIIAIISWRGPARGKTEGWQRDEKGMLKNGERKMRGDLPQKFWEGDELYWGGSVFMILVERPKFKFSSNFTILFKIQKGKQESAKGFYKIQRIINQISGG
jgi:hypothetical protein